MELRQRCSVLLLPLCVLCNCLVFWSILRTYIHANEDEAAASGGSQWGALFSGGGLRWVAVGIILSIANQLTGINGIVFYAP